MASLWSDRRGNSLSRILPRKSWVGSVRAVSSESVATESASVLCDNQGVNRPPAVLQRIIQTRHEISLQTGDRHFVHLERRYNLIFTTNKSAPEDHIMFDCENLMLTIYQSYLPIIDLGQLDYFLPNRVGELGKLRLDGQVGH